ncbi:porimin [Dipodomys spectabilis]|uniref:porimin n=1 Tax=Dipodomys spectabilis TaxID=105255 RepID=UPI001C535012|nr:porimin [Dipodomys spectabilis]
MSIQLRPAPRIATPSKAQADCSPPLRGSTPPPRPAPPRPGPAPRSRHAPSTALGALFGHWGPGPGVARRKRTRAAGVRRAALPVAAEDSRGRVLSGTMGLGARGARAALLLGALLALLGAAVDAVDPAENTTKSSNHTSDPVNSTTSVPLVSSIVTQVTVKSTATPKVATTKLSTNVTSTTLKSTPRATSVAQNVTKISTATTTTTHNSLPVSLATTVRSEENKGPKFDTGSFVGGIVLTLGVLSILYIGCKIYYSRRGIRYRTIDEHDAII